MGRPPKPSKIKAQEGNRGRRPLNSKLLQMPSRIPKCPSWMPKPDRIHWRKLCAQLDQLGVLQTIDEHMLACMASAIGFYVEAKRQFDSLDASKRMVMKTPGGAPIVNPLIGIMNRQAELIFRIGAEFGLTPAARERLLREDGVQTARAPSIDELLAGDPETFESDGMVQ